jgi:nitroreductase
MKVFWIVLICMILGINAMADENIMKTNQTTIANSADNKLLELSLKRRSIRRYTDEIIDENVINNIMKVALTAPSSFGHRPVEFVIVKDKETIQKLADCKSLGGSQIIGADAVIVVMVNQDRGEFWIEDGAIASSYILLAAEQYNVGACWVQIRNRRGLKKTSDEEIRDLLNIPDNYAVLNLVALGGKGEQKKAYTENDFDKNKIHYEKY